MKEKSVSVIGSMSLSKDGSKEEFRDMKDAFTDRGSFQERQGTATQCTSLSALSLVLCSMFQAQPAPKPFMQCVGIVRSSCC